MPGEEIILDTSSGAVSGNRYYTLPGGGVVIRGGTSTGTGYGFELTDQHGTATLDIGPALTAATATWREFTPYGAPRGPTVTWADNRGFLSKATDTSTGLTDVGARWYDPTTGTFQSLDPVFEAASPQQHNGYTYAGDNPVTNADPTGLMFPGGSQCGIDYPCQGQSGGGNSGGGGGGGGSSAGSASINDYSAWHNAAVQLVATYLRSIYGYNAVRTEFYIPDAHWQGHAYGRADVVLTQGTQMWVWEVKVCCGPAELEDGPRQLTTYIDALKGDERYPGWKIHRGFNIPQAGSVPGEPGRLRSG